MIDFFVRRTPSRYRRGLYRGQLYYSWMFLLCRGMVMAILPAMAQAQPVVATVPAQISPATDSMAPVLTTATPSAAASTLPRLNMFARTVRQVLPNGLQVIIQPDHRSSVVMTQIWYRVGAVDEAPDQTGLSHALEHMMFKGTPRVPGEEFARINAQFGGQNNAFTSYDYTGYYQLYPARYLGLALELEADRMRNLVLRPADFTREIQVVMEERRQRTDDNPQALAYERFRLAAYPTSPLRQPVIGHMDRLRALTVADLKGWYQKWYQPANATLVIVGDVQPDQVMTQVRKYFGHLRSAPLPQRASLAEISPAGERRLTLTLPVQSPALYMGFNLPSLSSVPADDVYPLILLHGILDGGLSARLEQRVIRQQRAATAIGSSYDPFARGPALLTITALPEPNKPLAEVEQAIWKEIEQLKTEPVTASERQRVIASYLAELVYGQDSIEGQARLLGSLASAGLDFQLIDQLPQRLAAVSDQQLYAVARRYLTRDNLTVLHLQGSGSRSASDADGGQLTNARQPAAAGQGAIAGPDTTAGETP